MIKVNCYQLAKAADVLHTRPNQRLNLQPVLDDDCIVRLKSPHSSADNQLRGPSVHLDFKDLRHRLSLTDLTP